jgi:hypothetical protein
MNIDNYDDHAARPDAQLASDQNDLQRQDQQQEQALEQPAALSTARLKQLMVTAYGQYDDTLTFFNDWGMLCDTDDVATLLSGQNHFDLLLQHLQGNGRQPSTRKTYLSRVKQALELQQVQQLLHPDVLQDLQARAAAAHAAAHAELKSATPAAAAAAAPALPGSGHLQQQQGSAAAQLTVVALRQLLASQHKSGSLTENQLTILNLWQAAAGGSDSVAVLLQQNSFSRLLQSLKEPGQAGKLRSPATRSRYLRGVLQVLELERVTQLLNEQQLQQLKQQVAAEKQQLTKDDNAARTAKRAQKKAAAAAAAVGDPAGPATAAAAAGSTAAGRSGAGSGGSVLERAMLQVG